MQGRSSNKIRPITAVAFAVGAMVGGGVFALSGLAVQQAGPAAILSFLAAGFMVFLSALSFAVIASEASLKDPGYAYIGKVLGSPVWGMLTSWCFYLAGIIGAAFVLNAFGVYAHEFVTSNIPATAWALLAALFLTLVNLGPASAIGRIEVLLVGGKLVVLLLLILAGLLHFNPAALQPFAPHGTSQILITSASLFIAFLGFNVITNMASDIDNPQKTIPRAIMWSMLIVMVIYIGVVVALLMAGIHDFSEASVGLAAQQLIGPIGGGLVIAGALISTLSSANANILGSSEIMVRLAAKKFVPTTLGRMSHGHPYLSVFAGAALYVILIMSGRAQTVIDLANVTAVIALIIVNIAAAKALASRSHTGLRLPLKCTLPVLGAAGAAIQFAFIPWPNVLIGVALAGSGIVAYILRRRYHQPLLHLQIVHAIDEVNGPLGRSLRK